MKSSVDLKNLSVATRGTTKKLQPRNRIQNFAIASEEKTLDCPSQADALKSSSPFPERTNMAVLNNRVPSVNTRSFQTDMANVCFPTRPVKADWPPRFLSSCAQ